MKRKRACRQSKPMRLLECSILAFFVVAAEVEANRPCRTFNTEVDCLGTEGCLWCPERGTCVEEEETCDSVFNPADCVLLTQESECTSVSDCLWCPDKELCRIVTQGCPGGDETESPTAQAITNLPTPSPTIRTLEPTETSPTPSLLPTSAPPTATPSNVQTLSPTISPSTSLPTESPTSAATFLPSTDSPTESPTLEVVPTKTPTLQPTNATLAQTESPSLIQTQTPTLQPTNSTGPPSLDIPATLAPSSTLYPTNSSYSPTESPSHEVQTSSPQPTSPPSEENNTCASLETELECLTTTGGTPSLDCFWCSLQRVCRRSYTDCPGNENMERRLDICAPVRDEADCVSTLLNEETNCTWCAEDSLCRAAVEECPGKGRSNPCRNHDHHHACVAQTDAHCTWFQNQCAPFRGIQSTETNATREDIFTSANCPAQTSEVDCVSSPGCLWCEEIGQCEKALHSGVCDDRDDDEDYNRNSSHCRSLNTGPECSLDPMCLWCDEQSTCRPSAETCSTPSGRVEVDFEYSAEPGTVSPLFAIQDDGLGNADPNSVSIGLVHLYEIDSSGSTIGPSLVDLGLQRYKLEQKVGLFFGGDIRAQKLSFHVDIDAVGRIEMETFVILSNGTIHNSDGPEKWNVVPGDIKFNLVLSNWTFCGEDTSTCVVDQESAYIDVAFDIKGRLGSPLSSESNRLLFDLGGNVPLVLSSQIDVDGTTQAMPLGFPRAEAALNQTTLVVFRFPRFADTIVYDPIVPYHTATIVDLNDGVVKDDTPNTISPTVAPSASPTQSPISSDIDTSDNDGLPLPLLIVIIVGGICLCLPSPVLALKRMRKRRLQRYADSHAMDPQTSAISTEQEQEERESEEGFHDEDSFVDPEMQQLAGRTPDSDNDESSDNTESVRLPSRKQSYDGYPMDDREEFSQGDNFNDEGDTEVEETNERTRGRPRLILSLPGFRRSQHRKLSPTGIQDTSSSRTPLSPTSQETLTSSEKTPPSILPPHKPPPSPSSSEKHSVAEARIPSNARAALALPQQLSFRGFEEDPIERSPPQPLQVPRRYEGLSDYEK